MSTRDRLAVEGARLFAERGYHGTSISDLAAALGIHKSSVYTHIAEKGDLLAQLALSGGRAFLDMLAGLPAGESSLQRLRLAFRGHLHIVQEQLHVAAVWMYEWRFVEGEARQQLIEERRAYQAGVEELFRAGVADGSLRPGTDPHRASLLFLSVGNWASAWMRETTDVDAEADAFFGMITEGLVVRRRRRVAAG